MVINTAEGRASAGAILNVAGSDFWQAALSTATADISALSRRNLVQVPDVTPHRCAGCSKAARRTNFLKNPYLPILQSNRRSLCTAALAFLYRRTLHCCVRTVDAAVAFYRLQDCLAGLAFVKPLARIGWHRLYFDMPAFWTSQCGF